MVAGASTPAAIHPSSLVRLPVATRYSNTTASTLPLSTAPSITKAGIVVPLALSVSAVMAHAAEPGVGSSSGPETLGVAGAVSVWPSAKACLPAVSDRAVTVTVPFCGLNVRERISTS